MKIKQNKKGFTLLEIMIVVIIVGVLAALALPRLFGTIEYSRSTEAFASISSIRSAMERCYLESQSFTTCAAWNVLDIPNPEDSPGNHFTYTLAAVDTDEYTITCQRNTRDGGITGTGVGITQTSDALIKCGTGAFLKLGSGGTACDTF